MDYNYWQKIQVKRAVNLETGEVVELTATTIPFVQECQLGGPIGKTWPNKKMIRTAMQADLKECGLTQREIAKADAARKREPKEFRMTSLIRQVQVKTRAIAQMGLVDGALDYLRRDKTKEALALLGKMKNNLAVANRGKFTLKNTATMPDSKWKPAPVPPEQRLAGDLLDSRLNKRTKGPRLNIKL